MLGSERNDSEIAVAEKFPKTQGEQCEDWVPASFYLENRAPIQCAALQNAG
jgi:hypothetical protein